MSKPRIPTKRNKLSLIFWTGDILLIVGTVLGLYTNSVIQAHKQLLKNPNITQQEKQRYKGSSHTH